ncbi:interferon-induced very large GTPase 1 isoform X4 [Salmo salar]|uniref:Interferon-induced very large GTPase 1 isoform X4 n=1 Tax=Salmo salar TaxID=8030 RepID=A0ABM3E9B3_SALSA|nr:interferon-induced very large GTPase 1-like isoform X4 [Salmo salar]
MEKPDDEGSPGATGGEGDGRDTTPVHSTGTPDGIAALGAMLQGFMLVQQQQQQSMQTMQQQMQQQISQLQEEVQNGKTKQLCVVTPLPAANPDTLTRPAPQSLDPAEEVLAEHLDKKEEEAEREFEEKEPVTKARQSKPKKEDSSGETTKEEDPVTLTTQVPTSPGKLAQNRLQRFQDAVPVPFHVRQQLKPSLSVPDSHLLRRCLQRKGPPEEVSCTHVGKNEERAERIAAPSPSKPEKGLGEYIHQEKQEELKKFEEKEPVTNARDKSKPKKEDSSGETTKEEDPVTLTTQVPTSPGKLAQNRLQRFQDAVPVPFHVRQQLKPSLSVPDSHLLRRCLQRKGPPEEVSCTHVGKNEERAERIAAPSPSKPEKGLGEYIHQEKQEELKKFEEKEPVTNARDKSKPKKEDSSGETTKEDPVTLTTQVPTSPGKLAQNRLQRFQDAVPVPFHVRQQLKPSLSVPDSHLLRRCLQRKGPPEEVSCTHVGKNEERAERIAAPSPSKPEKGLGEYIHQEKQEELKKFEEKEPVTNARDKSKPKKEDSSGETTKGSCLRELLSKTGLEDHYENKLTLSTVLEINANTTSDEPLTTMQSLPGAFLKKLMMANVNARSVKCLTTDQYVSYYGVGNLDTDTDNSNVINPLDLITALFLCSDGFLQQELVQKMSMCQFAVPLLLPNCDTKQSTLILWALRDIVRKFRPSSQMATNAFVEDRIVVSDIPMVSFVRLGESSLSKSQILNKLLSNTQQYHDSFVHHDMECGDVPLQISNGLVEISWYFPSGNRNIDMFTEPVAVANLRGDIRSFETQFSFLCQTSAAVYIFIDDFESDFKVLEGKITKAELFLVVNSQKKTFRVDTLKKMITNYRINPTNVIVKKKQNDAEFVKTLQSSVGDNIKKIKNRLTIENMADVAHQFGILVDEDSDECQSARKMADEITRNIKDTIKFKDKQLPLQGQIWKEISQLEKERCRLRKAGEQNIEHYKSSLKKKVEELRKKQRKCDMSDAMARFISGMSRSGPERSYFLKWMRINLDNLSRQNLSALRDRYKDLCQNSPEKKDKIKDLDKQLSDCSLGLEHFLRELGQLYEAACSLPESGLQRNQMKHLPGLCAQMLLDGFPIELVDGDASNIPLKWMSAVLTQLHTLVQSNSKIRVVTVLGVQSTGKSTLLNTMFGVQFAVSSGRCTRGAFMLLIKVNKELKEELKCDFIMIIDTEGLKSPALSQLDDSYEHDNELATLVIGLSDVTIINIAMENSTEMKDILQIVVHAFIRMKEVGKKPICHFMHQNVSDMSAHDNNMRDRKKLLEQLNEMTQAAARMEKKENITKFTDVMEYDPDTSSCYIPGLWHGTPPMAPVNAGYSEAVYGFKKTLMKDFRKCQSNDDLTGFLKWTQSLWEAVKFEKFIFSFRNSLVADAYSRLCSEYNDWEWAFQKEMYKWMVSAETKMSNIVMTDQHLQRSIRDVLQDLMIEASEKLSLGEKKIQDNLVKYFEKQDGHVNLVEKFKEDFVSSAKTLRKEIENTVKNKLLGAVEIKKGMTELNNIKSSQTSTLERKVVDLLQKCRQRKSGLSDDEALSKEFEIMWRNTLSEITFKGLQRRDVAQTAFVMLRDNLTTRGSVVNKMLVVNILVDCGRKAFVLESESRWKQVKNFAKHGSSDYHRKKLQDLCDDIMRQCQEFVTQRVKSKTDYYDTHIKELLRIIDKTLQQHTQVQASEECEVSLKQHICGRAAIEFQKMHDDFIEVNDPRKCLEQSKNKYLNEFKDLFHNRDQCQKKAEEFSKLLQTAVQDYVTKMIGPDVVDEVKTGKGSEDYSTRGAFQFSILKQLLTDGKYEQYREYIKHYERFVKDWLFDQIVQRLSKDNGLKKLEIKHLSKIVKIIIAAISNVSNKTTVNNIKMFIGIICDALGEKLVFPKDALDSILMLILKDANKEQFADYLTDCVREMEQSLAAEYDKGGDIKERLRSLPFKPHDEMFTSLFGCGEQCPFCGVPCEAGGIKHTKHHSSIHRSEGINGYRWRSSNKLVIEICSSLVVSGCRFSNAKTGGTFHPYKDYQKYYPDWLITGDSSIEASDYWKYVMTKFNERITEDRGNSTLPADIPEDWKAFTPGDALKSLKRSFNMK